MNLDQLHTGNWQLGTASQGQVVTDIDDIGQCILNIIGTQKGTDPLRPDFGVDLQAWVDKPMETTAAGIIADITYQVNKYEKRAIIDSIIYSALQGHLTIEVKWSTSNGQSDTTKYVK